MEETTGQTGRREEGIGMRNAAHMQSTSGTLTNLIQSIRNQKEQ